MKHPYKKLSSYGTLQGEFNPRNREKYKGCFPINYRSSWELHFMRWCDLNSNILEWTSESVVIPYLDESRPKLNGKPSIHRYYVDFSALIKQRDGNVKRFLFEIKPKAQVNKPLMPKKGNIRAYQERVKTYLRNVSKWKAATEYATSRGMEFKIITEHELGLAKQGG